MRVGRRPCKVDGGSSVCPRVSQSPLLASPSSKLTPSDEETGYIGSTFIGASLIFAGFDQKVGCAGAACSSAEADATPKLDTGQQDRRVPHPVHHVLGHVVVAQGCVRLVPRHLFNGHHRRAM